jgi:hypothetical protein
MAVNNVNELIPTPEFRNVNTEPQEIFPAIQGYEKEPLVSLEDAVKPLIPHVPDVERMCQMVKELCDAPKNCLTHDESASLLLYSMEWEPANQSFCFILNTTLQKANQELLKPWFLYLRLIMAALVKLPSEPTRFTIYRGLKMDLSAELIKGNKIVWLAFSSCTMSLDVLTNERFLGKNGRRTLFVIDCYSAKKIQNHTFYPDEEEVLFFPACQFEVIGCLNEDNGLLVVQLKEIEPKYRMINSIKSSKHSSQNVSLRPPIARQECVSPEPLEQRLSPPPLEQRILPIPLEQRILLTPSEQCISPALVPITVVSKPSERRLKSPSPVQQSVAGKYYTRLPPIQSSNSLARQSITSSPELGSPPIELLTNPAQQLIINRDERGQVEAARRRQPPPTKPSYNDKKPLKERETLHIDPVNICRYVLTTIVL